MSQKPWSKNRPQKPSTDPLYLKIRALLQADRRSNWAKANVSGLSPTTIRKWANGEVSHPQGSSLQMAARMLGKKVELVDR